MASAADMSVDASQETKLSPEEAMKAYLADQVEFATAMGVFNTKFKWAYPGPRALCDILQENPKKSNDLAFARQFKALIAKLGSVEAPVDIVGAIVKFGIAGDGALGLFSLLLRLGFSVVSCVEANKVTLVMDFTTDPLWKRGPVPHQLPSPPHTTISGFAIIYNKNDQFVVLEEDAFDPATNSINKRLGLVGGRKNPGQGASFLHADGGEIELETGIKGAEYQATLQQQMSVQDDMYGGDTIVNVNLYNAWNHSEPLVASGARQSAVPKWMEREEFLAFLAKKESPELAARVRELVFGEASRPTAEYEHKKNSKGKSRWTMDL